MQPESTDLPHVLKRHQRLGRKRYLSAYWHRVGAEMREAWLKENGPCKSCGAWVNLEIDHIDPATKIHSNFWNSGADFRAKELAKCQVLCNACHRVKTSREAAARRHHGSLTEYVKYHCRCDACRVVYSDYQKNRRSSRVAGHRHQQSTGCP